MTKVTNSFTRRVGTKVEMSKPTCCGRWPI